MEMTSASFPCQFRREEKEEGPLRELVMEGEGKQYKFKTQQYSNDWWAHLGVGEVDGTLRQAQFWGSGIEKKNKKTETRREKSPRPTGPMSLNYAGHALSPYCTLPYAAALDPTVSPAINLIHPPCVRPASRRWSRPWSRIVFASRCRVAVLRLRQLLISCLSLHAFPPVLSSSRRPFSLSLVQLHLYLPAFWLHPRR